MMKRNKRYDAEMTRVLRNNIAVFWDTSQKEETLLQEFAPSENFFYRMQLVIDQLQRNGRYRYYTPSQAVARRAAIIIISTALVLGTVSFSVKAIREPIIKFFKETFDRFMEFNWVTENLGENLSDYSISKIHFAPTYVPQGYVIEKKNISLGGCSIVYRNEEGLGIWYRQTAASFMNVRLDTENTEVHEIAVNGEKAIWFKNKGYTNLFVYNVEGCCHIYWEGSLEDLIQMAESLEPVEESSIK